MCNAQVDPNFVEQIRICTGNDVTQTQRICNEIVVCRGDQIINQPDLSHFARFLVHHFRFDVLAEAKIHSAGSSNVLGHETIEAVGIEFVRFVVEADRLCALQFWRIAEPHRWAKHVPNGLDAAIGIEFKCAIKTG